MSKRLIFLALAGAAVLAACDPNGGPSLQPAAADAAVAPDLRPHAGATYAEFVAEPHMDAYSLAALGLTGAEQDRFHTDFAASQAGAMVRGGGAEALVFGGCSATGCADGAAVVAIDGATGEAFVGVRDGVGAVVLSPNDRLEALLRLNSPDRRWDDPEGWREPAQAAAAP